jgi:hypothetical protein
MKFEEIMLIAKNLKRSECRDLTFGDTEAFIEDENGTDIGGGYFSARDNSIWLNINDNDLNFYDKEALQLRQAIPLKSVSRNDNEGEW